MKKVRESNFELLRCILMFMVLLLHYNNDAMGKAFSYVTPGSINHYFVNFVESLSIIGTNGFVLLTGYFSWKKDKTSLRKPFGLILYVMAYKVMFYLLQVIMLQEVFTLKGFVFSLVPTNWYIVLYVVLVILSPYINHMIKDLSKKSYFTLLVVMFLLFSVWPTMLDVAEGILGIKMAGINTVAYNGADKGYTIVNFVMLYLIGAFISKFNALQYAKRWDVLGYLICTIFVFLQETFLCAGWSYASPFVVLSVIFFMNIFRKISITSRVINDISKASLGVFLIHTQYLICNTLWSNFGIEEACKGSLLGCIWNMTWCCVVTYMLCTVLDMVCRFIATPVSKLLDQIPILNKNIIGINID